MEEHRARLEATGNGGDDAHAPRQGVAIIGMACVFAGAPDVDAFWANVLGKVDSITDPPPESWDPDLYYDPASNETDRVYCKRGGFLGALARFDPLAHGVPPVAVGGEPDQWLALKLARAALDDAGLGELDEEVRRRTAVILGRGATFNGGTAIPVQHALVVTQTLEILKRLHPEYTLEDLEELRRALKDSLPPMTPEVVPGLVPNIVAGRIANRLDLMGPSYTLDAACASSLVALELGVRDLLNGDCDLALAGGSQVWTPVPMLTVFCQLGALSRSEEIRPFDKDADGTILGEGLGMLVLKRLADAERDGDRIYAVIRGVGVASDGRAIGVMAPRLEGEELALRRAYEAAGLSPGSVELVEAHGTGTPLGDLTEVQALRRVFGERRGRLPSIALGSVKSMISHTVSAAGAAGVIKTALALHHKVLPPTLKVREPNPRFELEKTPFYLSTETRPWIKGDDQPRRAGVSSFGFGGINAHVVLEEYRPSEAAPARSARKLPDHRPPWDSELCVLRAPSPPELLQRVRRLRSYLAALAPDAPIRLQDLAYTLALEASESPGESVCLAVVAASLEDLQAKLQQAAERLADPECRQIQDRSGIYYALEPLARAGKLAFVFPGEGSQYANMLADLCLHFPEVRECFDRMDRAYLQGGRGERPSEFVFPRPGLQPDDKRWVESQLWDMDVAAGAVLTADEALLTLLEGLGLEPDVLVGHSSGEWAALRAAGVFGTTREERQQWISTELLDVYRQTIEQDDIPAAALLAIGAGREEVEQVVREAAIEARVAIDNCPHQIVVSVRPEDAPRLREAAAGRGFIVERLSFERPYHTPLFEPYSRRLRAALEAVSLQPPRRPVYSCAMVQPFPRDAAAIRDLASGQWVREVRFRQTVEKLYAEGVRIFVEVGPRGNLSAFIEDVLRKKPVCVVPADLQRRSGTQQLNHLAGQLSAQGLRLDLAYLFSYREPRRIDWQAEASDGSEGKTSSEKPLRIQFPNMQIPEELAERLRKRPSLATPVADVAALETTAATNVATGSQAHAPPQPPADAGARPASATSSDASPAGPALAAALPAAHAFLQTMEHFLSVQERVMTAYLRGAAGAGLAAGSTPLSSAPTVAWAGAGPAANGTAPPPNPPAAIVVPSPDPEPTQAAAEAGQPPPALQTPQTSANGAGDHTGGRGREALSALLLAMVSERTGYPVEAIDPNADLEADLGIDSIKRVEILGTFRQRVGTGIELEKLTAQRTLAGVVAELAALDEAPGP